MKFVHNLLFARIILITVLFVGIASPLLASAIGEGNAGAEEEVYISGTSYDLEQPLGGTTTVSSFGEYIQVVYQFSLGIIGIIAVTLIMFGGMRWISAAGNDQVIGQAKEIIVSAITGLGIAFFSFTLLTLINPELTSVGFQVLQIPVSTSLSELQCGSGAILTENSGAKQCPQWPASLGAPETISSAQLNAWITEYNSGLDPVFLKAIFTHESALCINANSSFDKEDPETGEDRATIGACGIVQMIPPTAQAYASSCGLSECAGVGETYWQGDATAQACCNQLKNEPEKAICAGVSELNNLANDSRTGGDLNLVAAGYNGGYDAIASSSSCPGEYVFMCEENHTDAGSYLQTYNYVTKAIPETYDRICAGNTLSVCLAAKHPVSDDAVAANYYCVNGSKLEWATCDEDGKPVCTGGLVTSATCTSDQQIVLEQDGATPEKSCVTYGATIDEDNVIDF